ncbi:MAG TPA: elongation factor Ts [Candidatus Paceibacterota bacterium]
MITNEQIKNLRDITGVSVMQCKKALEESKGDIEKAVLILRKKSGDIAAKKKDRVLGAGAVAAYIHNNAAVGALVELLSETDFVSGNEEFRKIAYDIAMHVTASNPEFLKRSDVTVNELKKVEELFVDEIKSKPEAIRSKILEGKLNAYFKERILLEQPFIKNPDITIQEMIDAAIQKFGEKIAVGRFARFSVK